MTDIPAARLQQLIDRDDINQILTAYPRAMDRLDRELVMTLYHPDARDDHAGMGGTVDEFADNALSFLRHACSTTLHYVSPAHIEVHADMAAAEAYYLGYHRIVGDIDAIAAFFGESYANECRARGAKDGDGHDFTCGGRYLDLFTRRDGAWRIADREITVEWKRFAPETKGGPGSQIEALVAPARRDRDDIAYRFFDRARAGHGMAIA